MARWGQHECGVEKFCEFGNGEKNAARNCPSLAISQSAMIPTLHEFVLCSGNAPISALYKTVGK